MMNDLDSRKEQFKSKFRNETGVDISQYSQIDKGNLTSRQNGFIGGYLGGAMTKQLVEMAKEQMEKE